MTSRDLMNAPGTLFLTPDASSNLSILLFFSSSSSSSSFLSFGRSVRADRPAFFSPHNQDAIKMSNVS